MLGVGIPYIDMIQGKGKFFSPYARGRTGNGLGTAHHKPGTIPVRLRLIVDAIPSDEILSAIVFGRLFAQGEMSLLVQCTACIVIVLLPNEILLLFAKLFRWSKKTRTVVFMFFNIMFLLCVCCFVFGTHFISLTVAPSLNIKTLNFDTEIKRMEDEIKPAEEVWQIWENLKREMDEKIMTEQN